jgi:hypothetical protein
LPILVFARIITPRRFREERLHPDGDPDRVADRRIDTLRNRRGLRVPQAVTFKPVIGNWWDLTMDDHPETASPHDETDLMIQIGRLVLTWNDLDEWIRHLILLISIDAPLVVSVLTADMNTSAALNALRALTVEQDASGIRHYRRMKAKANLLPPETREPEPFAPHILHFIEYVDRLREYRNFYLHGISNPKPNSGFEARGRTARGRLSEFRKPITSTDIATLTNEIEKCIAYGEAIFRAIDQSHPFARYASLSGGDFVLPTWPEKSPLPDRLVKTRLILLDERDPPQSSQA